MVRQSTLEAVRELVGSDANRIAAFEHVSRDGQATTILDKRARASSRRTFVIQSALMAIALALSALFVTALEGRSRSDLDLRLAHQTTLTTQLRERVAQRSQLQARAQARGQSLTSLAELYTFLAETRPIGWHVEQIELDAAVTSAVFSMDPSRESESGRFMERWREFFEGREIVLNRTVNRSGDIVLTLSARSEGLKMDLVFLRRAGIWVLAFALLAVLVLHITISVGGQLEQARQRAAINAQIEAVYARIDHAQADVILLEAEALAGAVVAENPAALAQTSTQSMRQAFAQGEILSLQNQALPDQRIEFVLLWRGTEAEMLEGFTSLDEMRNHLQINAMTARSVEVGSAYLVELTLRASIEWRAP